MRTRDGTRAKRQAHVTLTPRQEEVLRLMSRGLTNGEIAQRLGITLDGAKFHVAEILAKLEVGSREEAAEAWRSRPRRSWLPAGLGLARIAGATAAVGTAGLGVVVFVAVLAGGGSGSEPPVLARAGESATPADARSPTPPLPPDPPGALVACPSPVAAAPGANGIVDWVDFVNFEGVHYLAARSVPDVDASRLGAPYGRVQVNVSEALVDAWESRKDCEAAFLPVGEVLYRIDGYEPRFRIATSLGKVYEAYSKPGAATGEEFLDLRGKVARIAVQDFATGTERGAISDPATINRLVEQVLAAPLDENRDGFGLPYRLVFELEDGTAWTTSLAVGTNVVGTGLRVPAVFSDTISAAVAAAP